MYDTVRDSYFGVLSGLFKYPEDRADFVLPEKYGIDASAANKSSQQSTHSTEKVSETPSNASGELSKEAANEAASINTHTIVTWYSDDDQENPQNWSKGKKLWIGAIMLIYTLAVYIGASLYTAGIPTMQEIWGLSKVGVSVGLSIYVVGYGLGPLLMSPLSEIPQIGRNPPYIIGLALFVILCVPSALVNNYAGMLVLRFLLGFFGSPALASGGATFGDMYGPLQLPYALAFWIGGASAGPALGPLVGNYAVAAEGWRWAFWELLWLSGPVFLTMLFFLPETSADLILLRRAKRLRKLTGRRDLVAECEIRQHQKNRNTILYEALIKPWEINIKDPAVLFTTIYTGLIYGIYYSFFESFPIVFSETYGFSFSSTGLAYLAIAIGNFTAVGVWNAYFYYVANPEISNMMQTGVVVPPERRLVPGLIATFFTPAGLFIFAWTSRESIHWIVPLIGITTSMISNFIIAQCMLIYLPFTYPRYASSLFAANGLSRALLAAAAILFSIPMFENLGVAEGVSLLAALCCGCCVGIYLLYFFGANLRKRSRFAES